MQTIEFEKTNRLMRSIFDNHRSAAIFSFDCEHLKQRHRIPISSGDVARGDSQEVVFPPAAIAKQQKKRGLQ